MKFLGGLSPPPPLWLWACTLGEPEMVDEAGVRVSERQLTGPSELERTDEPSQKARQDKTAEPDQKDWQATAATS